MEIVRSNDVGDVGRAVTSEAAQSAVALPTAKAQGTRFEDLIFHNFHKDKLQMQTFSRSLLGWMLCNDGSFFERVSFIEYDEQKALRRTRLNRCYQMG